MIPLGVALAGALGAWARFELSDWCTRHFGGRWPYGTLAVNLLGAFALGVVVETFGAHWRSIIGTGFLGGFTTYSAFAVEHAIQLERHDRWRALAYPAATVGLGVLAALAGIAVA